MFWNKFRKGGKEKMKGSADPIYGIGVIGAAVYFLQHATTLQAGVIGIFKAIFWPGVIVYQVLTLLKM